MATASPPCRSLAARWRTWRRHARLDTAWAPLAAKLEQHCLNDIPGLDNPTSENLAAWLYAALQPALPTLRRVLVFETGSCGACHADGRTRIWKDLPFDSATRLPAAGGALARLHGHSYTLRLHLEGALDERAGWVVDFGAVKQAVARCTSAWITTPCTNCRSWNRPTRRGWRPGSRAGRRQPAATGRRGAAANAGLRRAAPPRRPGTAAIDALSA